VGLALIELRLPAAPAQRFTDKQSGHLPLDFRGFSSSFLIADLSHAGVADLSCYCALATAWYRELACPANKEHRNLELAATVRNSVAEATRLLENTIALFNRTLQSELFALKDHSKIEPNLKKYSLTAPINLPACISEISADERQFYVNCITDTAACFEEHAQEIWNRLKDRRRQQPPPEQLEKLTCRLQEVIAELRESCDLQLPPLKKSYKTNSISPSLKLRPSSSRNVKASSEQKQLPPQVEDIRPTQYRRLPSQNPNLHLVPHTLQEVESSVPKKMARPLFPPQLTSAETQESQDPPFSTPRAQPYSESLSQISLPDYLTSIRQKLTEGTMSLRADGVYKGVSSASVDCLQPLRDEILSRARARSLNQSTHEATMVVMTLDFIMSHPRSSTLGEETLAMLHSKLLAYLDPSSAA
jgi:hypothetical protein